MLSSTPSRTHRTYRERNGDGKQGGQGHRGAGDDRRRVARRASNTRSGSRSESKLPALDLPDAAFASKELCRAFARPTTADFEALKHLVRYLPTLPRLVWLFPWPDDTDTVDVFVDTDFAGCRHTPRSTIGGEGSACGRAP